MKRICVFCGSSSGSHPDYLSAARALGRGIAERGLGLVYGGADVGLMGAVADAALAAGGEVIGVIPRMLVAKEIAHAGLSELRIVETMHERKALMADLSDAFVAMPGGYGTLDEMCEILTWTQLGLHSKPSGVLNVRGYFDGLLKFLDHATAEQFLKPLHRAFLLADDDPQALLDRVLSSRVVLHDKWIDRREA